MFRLRTKLIIVLSTFVLLLLGFSAVLFIREKQEDVTYSTFRNTQSFAELVSEKIVEYYESYFLQQNYLVFNREIQDVFVKNPALKFFQIFAYDGTVLYDSAQELEKPYEGERRFVKDEKILAQIQSKLPSVQTEQGRAVYLKKSSEGHIQFVDHDEKSIESLGRNERIRFFAAPVFDRYTLFYTLSYDLLDQEISHIQKRILFLALFGLLVGIVFSLFFASRINRPVQKLMQSAAIIAKGDLKHRVDIRSGDEFEVLGKAFNSMAEDIEKNLKDTMYRERVSKELELAGKIQKDILPKIIPKPQGLDIAAGLLPADEVGGDMYDFLEVAGNRLLMYVGDVTGHGVPAGIVTSVANALFYAFSQKGNIVEAFVDINRVLKAKTAPNIFMTVGMLHWDGNKKAMEYANAGHEPLLHFHAVDSKVTATTASGIALGMIPDISQQLKLETVDLQPGDALLLYSDGLPEAWKNEKENYGMARLKRALSEYGILPSALAIRNAVLSDIKEFTGTYKQMDDMTILVIKRI